MKVLITGICGMVGSHMADYLVSLGLKPDEIIGLKRWRSPMDNVKHLKGKVTFCDGDLKDFSSIYTLISSERPDVIFHFASQSYVPVSFIMPTETLLDNGLGTLNLLEAVRLVGDNQDELVEKELSWIHYKPIIVIASSSEVYGQVLDSDIPIKETCPLRPQSPYAVSKVYEDLIAYQYFCSYDMKIIRTRLFTHTGARRGEQFHESSFAKQIVLIEKGLQEPIVKVGNLDSVRTYLDVRDAVRAYWLVKDCPFGEVYNIGGDYTCAVGDTLNKLIDLSNYKNPIKIVRDSNLMRPSDVTKQRPDSNRFRKQTGWKPEIPFEETMKSLLQYWRERV